MPIAIVICSGIKNSFALNGSTMYRYIYRLSGSVTNQAALDLGCMAASNPACMYHLNDRAPSNVSGADPYIDHKTEERRNSFMKIKTILVIFALLCIVPEPVEYRGARQCDIAKGIRRLLDNKNILLVVRILIEKGAMKFGEIAIGTQLSRNDLNHALQEMKDIGLIVQLEDKEYSLTQYCATLLKGLNIITKDFKQNQDAMFLPMKNIDLS